MAYLDAFDVTGDRFYLDAARKAGDALVRGQRPSGGWHYMIDFDPKGVENWYKNEASKFKWGMEEQRYFNGNATLDDGNSQGAARFLLRLYLSSKDAKYRTAVIKALDFLVAAQYPNGAFPQRFPRFKGYSHPGYPDYTGYYTLNDGATVTAIRVLVDGYEKLGEKKYLDAAKKAVDFLIAVQGPEDQAGWAEQYDPETMRPVKARTHEPAGYVVRESEQVIETLEVFYEMTGDRRYLRPIPLCIAWFERLNREAKEFLRPTARYYELETNLPIYVLRSDKTNEEGYGIWDWTNKRNAPPNAPEPVIYDVVKVGPIKAEYERIRALKAPEARTEYEKLRVWSSLPRADKGLVAEVLKSMDTRGAWITDCRVLRLDGGKNGMNSGEFEMIKGYSTGFFIRNLQLMTAFLKENDK
jgi:rhamnogalacturonyl hydrolase YesR